MQQPLEDGLDGPNARFLLSFEAFQRVTGAFQAVPAVAAVTAVAAVGTTPAVAGVSAKVAKTVTGTASFYQNPFTGNNSKYKIVLNGLKNGDKYHISIANDCGTDDPATGTFTGPASEVVGFPLLYTLNMLFFPFL